MARRLLLGERMADDAKEWQKRWIDVSSYLLTTAGAAVFWLLFSHGGVDELHGRPNGKPIDWALAIAALLLIASALSGASFRLMRLPGNHGHYPHRFVAQIVLFCGGIAVVLAISATDPHALHLKLDLDVRPSAAVHVTCGGGAVVHLPAADGGVPSVVPPIPQPLELKQPIHVVVDDEQGTMRGLSVQLRDISGSVARAATGLTAVGAALTPLPEKVRAVELAVAKNTMSVDSVRESVEGAKRSVDYVKSSVEQVDASIRNARSDATGGHR